MKKRALCWMLVLVMVFSLLPISAMASVYPINEGSDTTKAPKVVFNGVQSDLSTQYISSPAATVYDPGAPALAEGQSFQGWYLDESFSGDPMTIQELNDYIHVQENYNAIKNAGVLNVYPKVGKTFTVTYIAHDSDVDADIVQKVDVVPEAEAADYTVNAVYTPTEANQEFRGWMYNNHEYQSGDSLPVNEDVVLNAEVATGHWIKFDDNDTLSDGTNIHASYQKPVLVEHNESINLSDYAVSASGYEFLGWYTDKAGTTKVEGYAAGELTADVTLYAKWEQVDTANYKVIIWKQNITGDGYDYAEAITLNGNTGSTINTVTQQGTGDNAYARINGVNKQYTGFNLKEFDQNVTITPQGTAVLNVYYNRNQHKLTFRQSRNGTVYKTITALYGQPIGSNFPITSNGAKKEWRWDPQSSSTYSYVLVYIDTMPDEDVTFYRDEANYSVKTIHYYVEALPDQTATATYKDKGFIEYKSVDAKYYIFTEAEDYIDLVGFKKDPNYPPLAYYDEDNQLETVWENEYANDVYCFYLREDYPINYQDGIYVKQVTDNGQTTEQPVEGMTGRGQLNVEAGIPYQSNVADKGSSYTPTFDGYTFAGWYKDAACTQAYEFTTMPEGGITVYAKWILNRYQVEIKDGETRLSYFKEDYLGTIGLPNAKDIPGHENEVLVGWFTDQACTNFFNPDTKLDDNTDGLDTTFTEEGVKGKLTLYAKWRDALGSYIKVEYQAENGTAPTDSHNYTDGSDACAMSAPTGSTQFLYWVMLDKNNQEIPGATYYPGQVFKVDAENAKEYGEHYKVTLKAVYSTSTSETTSLTYDPNGGALAEGVPATVENIPVNGVVTLYGKDAVKDNYLFLGWNHDKTAADNHEVEFQPGQKVGVDELPDASNTLYAVWEKIDNHTYVIDFNAKMKVAEEATQLVGAVDNVVSGTNGNFVKADGDVTYQLNAGAQASATTNPATINSAYSAVDTAMVFGKAYDLAAKAFAADESWNQITTVPASSVYYDDSFTETNAQVLTPGDVVAKTGTFDGSGSHMFTFYGTGIDIYCTTNDNAGYVSAALYQGKDTTGTPYKTITVKNQSKGEYFNTPTIHFTDLEPAVYTVWIYANGNANYKIDGVRVYNPVQAGTTAAAEQSKTDEANANYFNLHDLLLNASSTYSALSKEDYEKLEDANAVEVSGVLYLDNADNICLKSNDENGEAKLIFNSDFNLYEKNSPINEIYLQTTDDKAQGVAFKLANWPLTGEKVYLGVSAPKLADPEHPAKVLINGNELTVSSSVDQYYDITKWIATEGNTQGVVSIKTAANDTNLISITNLKITGVTAEAITGQNPPADTANNSNSLNSYRRLAFAPMTTATVEEIAEETVPELFATEPDTPSTPDTPDTPDTPSTPDEPDDPKPGWNDGQNTVQAILKQLFQLLLKGIGGLFSGLGNW